MKWIAISGSWKVVNEEIKNDVESAVRKIIKNGHGIVTGGALGVDYIATQLVLEEGDVKKLKIFLPIKLERLAEHFRKRAKEGVVTGAQAEMIIKQWKTVKKLSPSSISDKTRYTKANEESYYARHTSIIKESDELYAFQVNESKGVQDAVDKARKTGKKVVLKKYSIKA
ncbi:MAG: hypothetical protein HY513_01185 [Candidatus Aenigmarchaeota archaeon]|nr:hypothetical protein [Candidatus Aenigmarchaeota archaeon]